MNRIYSPSLLYKLNSPRKGAAVPKPCSFLPLYPPVLHFKLLLSTIFFPHAFAISRGQTL
jgi:hypothetical protein